MIKVFIKLLLLISAINVQAEEAKIGLVAIGNIDRKIILYLEDKLPSYFGDIEIEVLKPINISKGCFNVRKKKFQGECLLSTVPLLEGKLTLGIVDEDLYSRNLNFIFGIAQSFRALIAIRRLRNEFYGLGANKEIFFPRILKEANHELGHTVGLGHCSKKECVMYFSNRLQDTDIKGPGFCGQCKEKLKSYLKKCAW